MPIYEYTCQSCETRFEKLVKSMSQPQKIACPDCGSTKTARTMSVFAVSTSSPSRSQTTAQGSCHRCGGAGPCAQPS